MENLLSVRGLTKKHDHLLALKGADFDVARGEVLGLLGENGAGKSTLISILGGWDVASSGTMTLAGEPYNPKTPDEALACGVGSIRQKFKVDPKLTVAQAIFRATFHADKSEEEQNERAQKLLDDAGLSIDPTTKMGELVRAEQALIEVVRMEAEETQLVLMDEVAATFNDYEIYQFHEITRRLVAEGRSVIYITHRLDEIRSLADRAVILDNGIISHEISPNMMSSQEIAFKMFHREIPMGQRPEEFSGEHEKLQVEGLCGADGFLKDVTFSVNKGEVLGLTGLRRSGINEVAAALVGVDQKATFKTLKINGEDVTLGNPEASVSYGIGYLSDDDDELGIANERSIAKTLMESAGIESNAEGFLHEVSALREVADQIQKLHIKTTNIQSEVGKLSGGDQQKVALARWMTTDCEILILNHPTRGIDVSAKSEIYKMLKELTEKGTSIILIGSDMSELIELCNRIAVMHDGKLVSIQSNEEATEDTLMEAAIGDDEL
ncbi:sugar ABC transporter ATP-binding protein [Rothia sp. P7208]|uniref:sugar ABC transporter ATP-binding protein n=1 Tax=Rothia sp. P7208 TaxID=3402660 RepID=UPI003AC1E156